MDAIARRDPKGRVLRNGEGYRKDKKLYIFQYLQAIMSYVWYECPKQGKKANIREMMDLLTKAKVAERKGRGQILTR